MSYLDRLKQLENGEIFHYTPEHEPTELTKGASDGFVGSIPGAYENIHDSGEATSYRWLMRFADREPVEVCTHPDAGIARMMCEYPDALSAEPLPEPFRPTTSCTTCTNSRTPGASRHCCARPELPPAYGEGHPLRQLPDDGGADCERWVSHTREGHPKSGASNPGHRACNSSKTLTRFFLCAHARG